jgi:MFS family permease
MNRPVAVSPQSQSRLASHGELSAADFVWAAGTGIAALTLFVATLQPGFGGPEDTPKFQFLGYALGTAHPPGYPLYSMLSNLFVRLPIGTIAYRANLFSAAMAALACALVYLIARQLRSRRWPACCAALGLAAGASFWLSAVFAEVYALAAMMAALTMALLLAWGERGGTMRLLLAVAAFGLGLGNHLTLVGILPAALLYIVLRDRRVLSLRVIAAAAAVLFLAVSQYGFIILRTYQGAAYLESDARSVSDLVGVMTARRFADKRFAFGPSVLLTDHLPAVLTLIGQELGMVGVVLLAVGCVAAARQRNASAAVLAGAGAGLLAMVLNLQGDLKGFITPMMVFLWPFTALGITAIAQALASLGIRRRIAGTVMVAIAAAMPLSNVRHNYDDADQSGNHESAQFHVALFTQLPARAAFVVEDYASDMALYYYKLTGEAGARQDLERVPWNPAQVRAAGRDRRVFAYARAAAVLQAQGLQFERWDVTGPDLDEWVSDLPAGSLIAGATAYVTAPFDLARIGHAGVRAAARPPAFNAFALIVRRPGAAWREGDEAATLVVDRGDLASAMPSFVSPVTASADRRGARLDLAGGTVAHVDSGRALAVFAPDGALVRTLELANSAPLRVPFQELVYELKGEIPCVNLSAGGWTDLGPALSTGSWVATLPEVGSVVVETVFEDPHGVGANARELMGGGAIRTTGPTRNADGSETLLTELTRKDGLRPVFRVALDRPGAPARARLAAGGTQSSVALCADRPVNPLFRGGGNVAVVRPDFESESYFGAGWSGVDRTAAGRVRHGSSGAVLLLPLDRAYGYRLSLDIGTGDLGTVDVAADDVAVGTCEFRAGASCEVALPAATLAAGVTALKLSVNGSSSARAPLTFRGARITRGDPR